MVVYGDEAILRHGAELLKLTIDWERLPIVDLGLLTAGDHRPGLLDAASGAAARSYVERATLDALAGKVAGVVTMPMNKEATQLTDSTFVGHTEFIAALCGTEKVTMMLTNGPLAVTHVSTHCSLSEALGPGRRAPRPKPLPWKWAPLLVQNQLWDRRMLAQGRAEWPRWLRRARRDG